MPHTVEENLQRLVTAKSNIATAITNKGGTVGENDGFESFSADIATIPAGLSDIDYGVTATRTLSKTEGSQTTTVFTVDNVPTTLSNNPVTSGAIYNTVGDINTILEQILSGKTVAFLFVTAASGVTVTVSKGGSSLPAQVSSGTELSFDIPEYGTWTVTGSNGSTFSINISQKGSYFATLISATISVTAVEGAIVTATNGSIICTETAGSGGVATITVGASGTYSVNATMSNGSGNAVGNSNTQSVNVTTNGETYNTTVSFATIGLTAPQGSTYTLTDNTTTFSGTSTGVEVTYYLPNLGTWNSSCTDGTQTANQPTTVSAYTSYTVNLAYVKVYGVIWNKTNTATTLTRTDDSANFSNPSPAISGGTGSSPFDNLYPWSEMTVETFADGNVMVKIPKFYYKITNSSSQMTIQIATAPQEGFKVSPAHQARYSGDIERDYVYLGKYKCNSSYKSVSGASPQVNITRSTARDGCRKQGTSSNVNGYYQQDFHTFWTVRMLYIVEFANWNSQAVIGYGCGNNSSAVSTGTTNSMQYHTGTMQSSRSTYGTGVQYRNIEDPWGNVYEWFDGIYFSSSSIYIINNPNNFSDSSNGVNTGTRSTSSGYISNLATGSGDYDWAMYPSAVSGSDSTYIPDYCGYDSSGVVLRVGGNWYQSQDYGLFYLIGDDGASDSYSNVGSRLLFLP